MFKKLYLCFWIFYLSLISIGLKADTAIPEDSVRSIILARLAGLIYWSEQSDLNRKLTAYRLCIFRDKDYFEFAKSYLKNKKVKGLSIHFYFVNVIEDFETCHVAYLGEVTPLEITHILDSNAAKTTVFVASSEQSAELGLHMRLYVNDANNPEFEINHQAFSKSGNEPSVGFVKLATKVYGLNDEKEVFQE